MAWNPARSVLVTSVAMVSPCLALPRPVPPTVRLPSSTSNALLSLFVGPGSKRAPMDTQLLAIFSDNDFRLKWQKWAKRLQLAGLSAAQEARAQQLRRKIMSGVGGHRGKVPAYDTLLKSFMDAGHSMAAARKELTADHKSSPAAESGLGHTFGQYTRFHAPFSTSR